MFESHLDTVPVADADRWSRDPSGEVADGRVFGRGAVDMKGPIAACLHGIAALRHGHHAGRVVISGSVAEELAEGPALNKVVEAVQPDAVIICEPSRARVAVGQRGRAEVTVKARGVSAHSAYPQAGRNAAEAMAVLVVALRTLRMPSHPELGDGLLVLTGIASEPFPSLSVVPDRCTASFDRRTLPGESLEDVLRPVRQIAGPIAAEHGVDFEVGVAVDDIITYGGDRLVAPNFAPAWTTDPDSTFVRAAVAALRAADVATETFHYAFCTNGSGSAWHVRHPDDRLRPGPRGRGAHHRRVDLGRRPGRRGARLHGAGPRAHWPDGRGDPVHGGELHPLASALTTTPSIGRARTRPFETRGTSDG